MYCCAYAPGNLPVLLEWARQFSPLIEEQPDAVIFDVGGLEGLYGPPASIAHAVGLQIGIEANIAIASNPDAAVHAARGLSGITVIEAGNEAVVLTPLPLHLLGGSPEVALSLDLWGVRTFGQLAKLPPSGVAARLGAKGIALQTLARGEGYRRLRLREEIRQFEAEFELDSPVELLDSLCFVLARLMDELLAKLKPLAMNEIRVTLTLERAADHVVTLRLPVPMNEHKVLLKLLYLELADHPPSQPVVKVQLHAAPTEARRTQRGLFAAASPEPERLETTLARIRHLVGGENVGSPYLLNTYRPDHFVMRAFSPQASPVCCQSTGGELKLCLRRFRPPRYAQVTLEHKRPARLSAFSVRGRVETARGPWRMSGNWWDQDRWNRDRWDIALDSGLLLRIFQEIDSQRWFVEGSYD